MSRINAFGWRVLSGLECVLITMNLVLKCRLCVPRTFELTRTLSKNTAELIILTVTHNLLQKEVFDSLTLLDICNCVI